MKTFLTLCLSISIHFLIMGQGTAKKSQAQETWDMAENYLTAEMIKAIENNLIKSLEAERNSRAVSEAMNNFFESVRSLERKDVDALAQKFAKAKKASLIKLGSMSPKQLMSYAQDLSSRIDINPALLKQAIYREGDRAGAAVLRTLSNIDQDLAKTGKVSQELLIRLRSEASGLDPKQGRAFYDLVKGKISSEWMDIKNIEEASTKGIGKYVGTVVDGVFVLSDAYDIYYTEDEPEVKAIKATSKIVDYSSATAGGAATAALGGGLGPGLVVAFTANRLSTLYTEMAMLQREREMAKEKEQQERINNSILVRRQLVNINRQIKAGKLDYANFLLIKVQKFLHKHRVDNLEKLFELRNKLEQKAKDAERYLSINQILNKARYLYRDALKYYQKGVELPEAKKYAQQARQMLVAQTGRYPEIKRLSAIPNIETLIGAITQKIQKARPLLLAKIQGPDRVYAGEYIHYLVHPRGGLPYYRTAGNTEGNVSDDIMTVYWEAPSKPGETLATFYLRDCLDQQAKISKTIEVVPRDEEVIFEISNDCGDQTHFVRFNDQKESVSFRLYTFEEVLEITRQNASSPITEDYRIDIARSLHNTYLSITDNAMNKDILKNIPTLSENCYKKIISGELNIMYHGTYTNHETGETLFFEDGKMERVIKEGEEQELRGAGNPFGGVRLDDVN